MRSLLPVMLLGLITADALAQELTVYKCLEGEGHVYQSTPCSGAELRHWAVRPEAIDGAPGEPKVSLRPQPPQNDRSQRRRGSSAGQRSRAGAKIDACAQARLGRERAYAKAGLKRDFAMSSFWDNKVHEACW